MQAKVLDKSLTTFLEANDFNLDGAKDFIYEIKQSDVEIGDIILSEASKSKLNQIVLEYKNIDKLKSFNGLFPVNKIILEGDSGCGKTSTALALANALSKGIIIVNLSEIISSKLGETSKNLNKVFKYAQRNDCIIFLDEFDSLSKSRSDDKELGEMKRLVNSIIQLLDFGSEELIVIGATNFIENLDTAIKRRFEVVINFTKPTEEQIKLYLEMMQFHFEGKVKISFSKQLIKKLIGTDFFGIKTMINSVVKRKIINEDAKKITITTKDIIL